MRRLLSRAIVGEGVTDIFKLAGLKSPDTSILSDEFLPFARFLNFRNTKKAN
ncbi:MAG: DUF3387 domain-containing protein [SAR202 cluster bacterium]|nr:DUF3387 domain-containing protein [SAR202 cluster bacterium]